MRILRVLPILVLSAALFAGTATHSTSQPVVTAPFTPTAYLAHVQYLASDVLAGRQPGTPGIQQAAGYIADQFRQAGLEPAGDDDTFFQCFDVRRGKRLIDEQARLRFGNVDISAHLHADWRPSPFTEMKSVDGPLAFAGYGIEADKYGYNDYADFDATGKVVLVFRYEPRSNDPQADFGGRQPSHHAQFWRKARVAADHGAKALLIVNPPVCEDPPAELFPFAEEYTYRSFALPVAHVTPALAEKLVQHAGIKNLTWLQRKLEQERTPMSRDLGIQVHLDPGVEPYVVKTCNVVGRLPGNGATDEAIVVGAHYDHLGRVRLQFNRTDDEKHIHNGADDNASGTAAVIELARGLAAADHLRRDVLFVAFTAEEMGLLGSKHFVEHPPIPLENMRAMINFDMVGRLHQNKFTIFGLPTATEFSDIVARAAEPLDLTYRASESVAGNSDHHAFYKHDIPVLFAFTGVHGQYHRPEDDWQLIDAEGGARLVTMFADVVTELANLETGPTFHQATAPPSAEDLQKKPAADHATPAPTAEIGAEEDTETARPTRPRVRLGIIPDFANQSGPGLVADTVLDDGGAKTAGMLDGDRILRIGDYEIKDIYGYMDVLKEFKPGQVVDIVVERDGHKHTLKVKLSASTGRGHGHGRGAN